MWFNDADAADHWADAIAHLSRDRILRKLIARLGPCTLRPRRDYFVKLVQSILSQQVSVKAADAMYRRLAGQFPAQGPTPARMVRFLTQGDETLIRACGLSRQKRGYLLDLSQRFTAGTIRPQRFASMTDDEVIATLTQVKGIGVWTVQMLLIFALARPDVWPTGDLGLQHNLHINFPKHFATRPKPRDIESFADKWRPYRSIATWYLWQSGKK